MNVACSRKARLSRAPMPRPEPLFFFMTRGDAVAGASDRVQQRPVKGFVYCLAQRVEVAAQGVGVRQQVAPDFAFQLVAG